MADDDREDGENTEEGEAQPGFVAKNKKMILLGVIALVLIGASVGGTLAVVGMFSAPEEVEEGAEGEGAEGEGGEGGEPPLKQAIYYPIKPPIMVSFEARGRQRLMQAEVTLLTRESDVVATVEQHMPMIRNSLVLLMSGQIYEDIQTAEGKELMRVQATQQLQQLIEAEIGKPGIEEVLFTNIIVQ